MGEIVQSSGISTSRKRRIYLVPAILLSAVLASCSAPAEQQQSAPNPLERDGSLVSEEWSVDADVISQPVIVDGVALVVARTEESVELLAVNAQDGQELWRADIHPGIGAPGISLVPNVTETQSGVSAAVFLQAAEAPSDDRGSSWWTEPVALNLKTGEEFYRGEAELINTRPDACEDETDMCFSSVEADGEAVAHRINLDTSDVASGTSVVPLDGRFREIGEGGIYSVVKNGIESISRISGGEILWTADIVSIFGAGATTDLGWNFSHLEFKDLVIASVGLNPTEERDIMKLYREGFSVPLGDRKVVGLRASTGEVLWTATGADSFCALSLELTTDEIDEGSLPVRCEYDQGTMELPDATYENALGKIVGYDPLTGGTKWETAAVSVSEPDELLVPSVSRGETVLFGNPDGLELVNTSTGDSRPATEDDVFLCTEPTKYPLPANSPFAAYGELGNEGSGGPLVFPCDLGGQPANALTKGSINDATTVDGDLVLLSTDGQLAAYVR